MNITGYVLKRTEKALLLLMNRAQGPYVEIFVLTFKAFNRTYLVTKALQNLNEIENFL